MFKLAYSEWPNCVLQPDPGLEHRHQPARFPSISPLRGASPVAHVAGPSRMSGEGKAIASLDDFELDDDDDDDSGLCPCGVCIIPSCPSTTVRRLLESHKRCREREREAPCMKAMLDLKAAERELCDQLHYEQIHWPQARRKGWPEEYDFREFLERASAESERLRDIFIVDDPSDSVVWRMLCDKFSAKQLSDAHKTKNADHAAITLGISYPGL